MAEEPFTYEEAASSLEMLCAEVEAAFSTDRFAMLANRSNVGRLVAAASLSHCCELARVLDQLHAAGNELAARLVTRAVFEAWAVGLYLRLGGVEAYEALRRDLFHELKVQDDEAKELDRVLQDRRREAEEYNASARQQNEINSKWNSEHPDAPQRPIFELRQELHGVLSERDLSPKLERFADTVPEKLPLKTILGHLRSLTLSAGNEESFDLSYNLMFRGLSTVGAHTNLQVLEYYLDTRDGSAVFTRVRRTAEPPRSLDEANLVSALLLVAHLAERVLGAQGCPHPVATRTMERFRELANESEATSGTVSGNDLGMSL